MAKIANFPVGSILLVIAAALSVTVKSLSVSVLPTSRTSHPHVPTTSSFSHQLKRSTSLFADAASDSSTKKKKKTSKKAVAAELSQDKKKSSDVEDEPVVVRKSDIISALAAKTGRTKADSEAALSAVLDVISEEVSAGKKVNLSGFGIFKLNHRAARKGRNPRTGEDIDIAASSSPSFVASRGFKEKVKGL